MKNLRSEVIKYAKMLNSRKLSALRSGNISARFENGFLIMLNEKMPLQHLQLLPHLEVGFPSYIDL